MIRAPWRHRGDRQTRWSNPSNLSIWHLFLLSFTLHTNFNHTASITLSTCSPSLSLSLSMPLPLSASFHYAWQQCTYCQIWLRNSRQKVREIIFPVRRGPCWHKGKGNQVSFTTMAANWPCKSWELRARCRADDVPYPNHLTWLVMPTTRPVPMGLSEAEMCVWHSKECTNLLFIKCGETWEWRLNGDLSVIQPLHRRCHMVLWLVTGSAYGPS